MQATKDLRELFSNQIPLSARTINFILYILFFLSGVSALIYQVMWQRMLFGIFGVDLVSITIVVSAFMFGLGVGGLVGGRIADKMPAQLLAVYVAIEVYIAIFGFFSPAFIDFFGNVFFTNYQWVTAFASFFILLIPTFLMGATFPVLVTHVNRYNQNVGDAVGGLYFANTLGGALGAYLGGFVLLFSMDVAHAIYQAAILNVCIAICALIFFRRKA